jgi:hypothetical protein
VLAAGKETVVDPNGPQALFDRAATPTDKKKMVTYPEVDPSPHPPSPPNKRKEKKRKRKGYLHDALVVLMPCPPF